MCILCIASCLQELLQKIFFDDITLLARHTLVRRSGISESASAGYRHLSQSRHNLTVSALRQVLQLANYIIRTARLAQKSNSSWPTTCGAAWIYHTYSEDKHDTFHTWWVWEQSYIATICWGYGYIQVRLNHILRFDQRNRITDELGAKPPYLMESTTVTGSSTVLHMYQYTHLTKECGQMQPQLGIWKRFIRSLLVVDRCSLSWGSGRGLLEVY